MRTCKRCGKIFDNKTKYEQYCMSCRKPKGFIGGIRGEIRLCPTCGKTFSISDYSKKYCSKKCYDERNKKA